MFEWLEIWEFVLLWEVPALLSVPSVLLRRKGRPVAALAWLLALFAIPWAGVVLWWLIGCRHLERKKRRRREAHDALTSELSRLRDELPVDRHDAPSFLPFRHIPADLTDSVFPPTADNHVAVIEDGEAVYASMAEAIGEARHHIHFLFYIWEDDIVGRRFRDLLAEKARAGVEVRIYYDSFGSAYLTRRFLRPCVEAGAKVIAGAEPRFLTRFPTLNFRNHRKLVVVDGKVGFVGGLNVGEEYLEWHDIAIRMRGPILDQVQETFADDWYFATGENLTDPSYFGQWKAVGDEPGEDDREPGPETTEHPASCALVASGPHNRTTVLRDTLFMIINSAQSRIELMTPYFVPDKSLLVSLQTAVYRGVDVRLMVPAKNDVKLARLAARAYYEELLDAGAKIFEYQPRFLHAKTLLVDDRLAVIGSANIDNRSVILNFEVSCVIESAGVNATLHEIFERNVSQSEQILPGPFSERSYPVRLAEAAANLLGPLM